MIQSKKYIAKRIVKWLLIISVIAGTNYGTVRLVNLLNERNELQTRLEVCTDKKNDAVMEKINMENELIRPSKEQGLLNK